MWAAVRWYVRELLGDARYERYVERHLRAHPDTPPLSRRAYWRRRQAEAEGAPVARCC